MRGRIVIYCFLIVVSSAHLMAQNVLPTPTSMQVRTGTFIMETAYLVTSNMDLKKKAFYLTDEMEQLTKLTGRFEAKQDTGEISLLVNDFPELGREGYYLDITSQGIIIKANNEAGIFYGITTLLQLAFEYKAFGRIEWPLISITDVPRMRWRSFMFDSGRQYHTMRHLKEYLDHMAMLKMNVFHWHLTEHDGWRIEIKRYPKLTSIGSNVGPWPEQKGYYTQDQIKEVIAYAAERNIEVVPEIDLPGHSNAALHAYPEMACMGERPVRLEKGHSPVIFCGGREATYTFLENVLDEVMALFPSQYIHLGGDEAPKDHWAVCDDCQARTKKEGLKDSHELQLYFSKRLALYLQENGRKAIFWDDVVRDNEGIKMPANTVINWWNYRKHKEKGLVDGVNNGFEVIAGTNYYTYLFFPITPWAGCNENRTFDLKMAYESNPSDIDHSSDLMLGMSASMWGDYNIQQNMNDRFVFPRIYALTEQMWSTAKRLPFNDFYTKVKGKYPYLTYKHIDYGPALKSETPDDYSWQYNEVWGKK
ncbi:beta-N-acetylhexosaminidase [Reichenbachiella carrageenanivorans]|uniref:beta-N-acetylhexosaminidase n=1 Tax=Reichenbachiella carrageenanivorans TaxID=2979869 RepID=A0ABY6D7D0_9BACT|nr:beta-N-acetylhexosaminidase [Reichenbachiella carrageenanivorans]UXX80968.1 beta-N-acetylhexosaminidase [Reichenbachiella carrageenanivorans]